MLYFTNRLPFLTTLSKDAKGTRRGSISTLMIKQTLGKMWALSERKWETWLLRIWRRLKYSLTFLLLSSPEMLQPYHLSHRRQSQGLGERRTTHYRRRSGWRPSKELEGAQVQGTWWDASAGPEGTGRWSG